MHDSLLLRARTTTRRLTCIRGQLCRVQRNHHEKATCNELLQALKMMPALSAVIQSEAGVRIVPVLLVGQKQMIKSLGSRADTLAKQRSTCNSKVPSIPCNVRIMKKYDTVANFVHPRQSLAEPKKIQFARMRVPIGGIHVSFADSSERALRHPLQNPESKACCRSQPDPSPSTA